MGMRSQSAQFKWQNLVRKRWEQLVNGQHRQEVAIRRFQPAEIFRTV